MKENEELYAKIEELEKELAEERIRRKITEDNSDCALWEYEIASKKYVLSRKLGGKWNTTNMVIENYQEQMHNWGFVHPDDWATFDEFCAAMDRGDEHISYEVRQVSDESAFIWFRYVGIPVYDKDHKPYKIMGKTLDITGEKKNQELLKQKAERDSLTDLYNKAKMRKLVEKHIRQADDTEGAFLIIDIDDFKTINDTCGHLYGDEVLIKIANTILISAGMEDYAGRIGGDEFCVFCRGKNVGQHAVETAERISRMADQIQLSGRRVTLSMGISRYPEDASSYEELYQKADQALYRVKRSGKNAFSVYDKNYNYVDYTSERKGTDRETGFWQELEKYYKGRQWTETESEILSTMTRMMESYLNHEEYAGNVREREKDTEKPEPENMCYVAVMAKFSYLYQKYDVQYATQCLQHASSVYTKLMSTSGRDAEKFMALTELYRAAGLYTYRNQILEYKDFFEDNTSYLEETAYLYGSMTYLATRQPVDVNLCTVFMESIRNRGEELAKRSHNMIDAVMNVNNGTEDLLKRAEELSCANYVLYSYQYTEILEDFLHYLMGRNRDSVSYYPEEGDAADYLLLIAQQVSLADRH